MNTSVVSLGGSRSVVSKKNYNVLPGDYRVVKESGVSVSTLLGSCVTACIRDRRTKVGGLNHFLLPEEHCTKSGYSTRYGIHAMEVLVNEILKLGVSKSELEAKVFGGGAIIKTNQTDSVGARNAKFVLEYLKAEEIEVTASDLGGVRARKIIFIPSTGLVRVNRLPATSTAKTRHAENKLRKVISKAPKIGGMELF